MNYLNFLFVGGISFLPLYLWSSGGLQISHYLLAIYCGAYLWSSGIGRGIADFVLIMLVFFLTIRESFSVFLGENVTSLMPVLHLLFSLMIFNVFRRVFKSERAIKLAVFGLTLSALTAVLGVLFIGYSLSVDDEGRRAIGTFNNPNQLGYFSVCIFSIAFLLNLDKKISKWNFILLISVSLFLSIASLSKSAMLSIAMPLFFIGFYLSSGRSKRVIGLLFVICIAFLFWYFYTSGTLDQFKFFDRLLSIGSQSDDSLEERGYGAIFEASVFELFFGFGYWDVVRIVGHEVHSTIFSFLAGYGLIGASLFIVFNFIWVKYIWQAYSFKGLLVVAFPPLFYGIAHNGSRFTIFWILLALSFSICQRNNVHLKKDILLKF